MAVDINKDSIVAGLKKAGGIIAGQLDFVFLGLLGLSTLGVLILYAGEFTTAMPRVTEPSPIKLTPTITVESEVYTQVFEMLDPPPTFEKTEFQQLIDFNMFDARAARDAEELHDEAKKKLNDAEEAFEEGNYERAKTLAQEALERAPTMQAAIRLIERVEAATAPAEGEEGGEDGGASGDEEGDSSP